MSKPKPVKLTTLTEQEAKDLYGDVEPQPMAAVGFEGGGGGGGPVDWEDIENKPNLADGNVYSSFEFERDGETQTGGAIAKSYNPGEDLEGTEPLDDLVFFANQSLIAGDADVFGDLSVTGKLVLTDATAAQAPLVMEVEITGGMYAGLKVERLHANVSQSTVLVGNLEGGPRTEELTTILSDLVARINALETSNSDLISRVEALEAQL